MSTKRERKIKLIQIDHKRTRGRRMVLGEHRCSHLLTLRQDRDPGSYLELNYLNVFFPQPTWGRNGEVVEKHKIDLTSRQPIQFLSHRNVLISRHKSLFPRQNFQVLNFLRSLLVDLNVELTRPWRMGSRVMDSWSCHRYPSEGMGCFCMSIHMTLIPAFHSIIFK